MYNIRKATVFDAEKLAVLGKEFFAFSAFKDFVEYDVESAEQNILKLLTQGIVFVAEDGDEIVGAIVGLLSPLWFNSNAFVATELAWFIAEEHRKGTVGIRLYKAFEEWGYANGAQAIVMSDLVVDGGTPASQLFDKLGFTTIERSHIKKRG